MAPRARTVSRHRSADFGFSIKVGSAGPAGVASTISVESELTRLGLPGLVLRSSDRRAPLISGERWPVGVRWSIDDRLREPGARKGRVLAIWQGDQVIAACGWHLHEKGPPVILDLGCRVDLDEQVRRIASMALMLCLRQIAGAPGLRRDTESLRWADPALDRIADREERNRVRHAVRGRAQALGFEPLRPRPKWRAKSWVVERRF
jgi:hypothetical protein